MIRFVDRGAITAAYVGIGMAVTIVVSFLLVIPIEWVVWILALPSGLLIGYYANQRSNRRAGPWRRITVKDAVRDLGGIADADRVFDDLGFATEIVARMSLPERGQTGVGAVLDEVVMLSSMHHGELSTN